MLKLVWLCISPLHHKTLYTIFFRYIPGVLLNRYIMQTQSGPYRAQSRSYERGPCRTMVLYILCSWPEADESHLAAAYAQYSMTDIKIQNITGAAVVDLFDKCQARDVWLCEVGSRHR